MLDEERLTVLQPTQRTFVIAYDINALDQVTRVTHPVTAHRVDYAPDVLGRPTKAGDFATSLSWHPTGQLQSLTLGNGRRVDMSFDNRMRVASMRTTNASTANKIDYAYTYDDTNNMTRLDDNRDPSLDIVMTYDDLGRLETANGTWGNGWFTYSTTGDIGSYHVGGLTKTYTYLSNERLSQVTGGSRSYVFSYDGYGNVTDDGDSLAWLPSRSL